MKSGESHTLHGNVFLIAFRMKQQSLDNHLFRVHAYLTIAGNEVLKRLGKYLNNSTFLKKVEEYEKENQKFRKDFNVAWEATK